MLIFHMIGFDLLAAIASLVGANRLLPKRVDSTRSLPVGAALGAMLGYRSMMGSVATLCGLLHRRHLMVWAVFAPKVIFLLF